MFSHYTKFIRWNMHTISKTRKVITVHSNHPSNIIKPIPIAIETGLSNHLSNITIFCQVAEDYEKALKT